MVEPATLIAVYNVVGVLVYSLDDVEMDHLRYRLVLRQAVVGRAIIQSARAAFDGLDSRGKLHLAA